MTSVATAAGGGPVVVRVLGGSGAPGPRRGRNARGGRPRFDDSIRVTEINEKHLVLTGANWFLPWSVRKDGFPAGQWRLVPETGNGDDPPRHS